MSQKSTREGRTKAEALTPALKAAVQTSLSCFQELLAGFPELALAASKVERSHGGGTELFQNLSEGVSGLQQGAAYPEVLLERGDGVSRGAEQLVGHVRDGIKYHPWTPAVEQKVRLQ